MVRDSREEMHGLLIVDLAVGLLLHPTDVVIGIVSLASCGTVQHGVQAAS